MLERSPAKFIPLRSLLLSTTSLTRARFLSLSLFYADRRLILLIGKKFYNGHRKNNIDEKQGGDLLASTANRLF
jgi:hypothetical protein